MVPAKKMLNEKKAMSGISTLIIFIALILVAAVAALVLLQTVGSLQSQALTTGKESKQQVSTNLQIVDIVGYSNSITNIGYLRISCHLAPGSSKINLDTMYLTYTDGNVYQAGIDYNSTGDYNAIVGGGNSATSALGAAEINLAGINFLPGSYYSVLWLGESVTYPSKTDIKSDETVEIFYRSGTLGLNKTVLLQVTPSGASPAEVRFKTPPSFDDTYIKLFP